MLLLLFTEFFIGFHHCIWQILLGIPQLLPPTLEETIIVYLCQESGLHMAENSFYYKGTQIWNSLNASIYAETPLARFKKLYS